MMFRRANFRRAQQTRGFFRVGVRGQRQKTLLGVSALIVLVFAFGIGAFLLSEGSTAKNVASDQSDSTTSRQLLTPIDMEKIPGGEEFSEYNLYSGALPQLNADSKQSIESATASFEEAGYPVGFVFVNLESGKGISSNVDTVVYGASSIKGPYAAYVCEALIDNGDYDLADQVRSFDEDFHSNGSASIKSLLMGTIEDSSNGMFAGLRRSFEDEKYESWLLDIGVGPGVHPDNDLFAWYSARDAAKLWTETYCYLDQNTATAEFLEDELAKTKVSFIRDGILQFAEQSSGENTEAFLDRFTVFNKAGWCATDSGVSSQGRDTSTDEVLIVDGHEYREFTEDTKYDSVCDNGIVTIEGQDYLLCVMSGARYCDSSVQLIQNLIKAIIVTYPSLD